MILNIYLIGVLIFFTLFLWFGKRNCVLYALIWPIWIIYNLKTIITIICLWIALQFSPEGIDDSANN